MTMHASKRKKLEARGWKIGSASDFLHLTPEEATYIELKHTLGISLKQQRTRKNLSQVELAKLVNTSQSRVAKMEAGDPSVSIDLIIKSLLALGVSKRVVARAFS